MRAVPRPPPPSPTPRRRLPRRTFVCLGLELSQAGDFLVLLQLSVEGWGLLFPAASAKRLAHGRVAAIHGVNVALCHGVENALACTANLGHAFPVRRMRRGALRGRQCHWQWRPCFIVARGAAGRTDGAGTVVGPGAGQVTVYKGRKAMRSTASGCGSDYVYLRPSAAPAARSAALDAETVRRRGSCCRGGSGDIFESDWWGWGGGRWGNEG